ncbi:histidine kinase-like ATPase, partial [Halenospora varia]
RYREQFVDVLCHELRNPVCGIIGNVELLQTGLELRQNIIGSHREAHCNSETRLSAIDVASLQSQLADDIVSVDAIAVCAEHMKVVTDDVLSLSKLEERKVVLEHVPLDLKATIGSVIKMFSISAQKKGIELLADLPSGDLHVLGDQGRIAQVLVNLVSNAIKFTDMGSVIVELSYLGQTLPGSCKSRFKIAVRDTGCGLENAEMSLLFQRFAQPTSTSFAKHGGTGLGLYISKHLVELMGGLLNVESQKWKGSTFSFTFQAQ